MHVPPSVKLIFLFTFGWVATALHAIGQIVIGPPSGSTSAWEPAPKRASYVSSGMTAAPLSSLASALTKPRALWQRGPVSVSPNASYEIVYGTGMLRLLGSDEKVTMQTINSGVLIEAGNRASADYTFTHRWYSSRKLSDSTDHNVSLRGGIARDEWKVGLSGNYGTNTNLLAETAEQTRDETYTTAGDFSFQLGRYTELELNLSHSDRSASPVSINATWEGSNLVLWNGLIWLRYHVSQRLSFAAGFGAGYDEIETGPDMENYRPLFQIDWKPTKKITFSTEVGLERRRTLSNPIQTDTTSLYNGTVSYAPFEATMLTLKAARGVAPSYFSGQSTRTESWGASMEQRILRRLFFSANVSQSRNNYKFTTGTFITNRIDRSDSFNLRLGTAILRKGSVAVFYQHSRNRSTLAIYQYETDQIGANLTYRF